MLSGAKVVVFLTGLLQCLAKNIFLDFFLSKSVFGFLKTKKRTEKKVHIATKLEGGGGGQ